MHYNNSLYKSRTKSEMKFKAFDPFKNRFKFMMMSDMIADIITAPFRYFLEIRRGWTQLGIKSPVVPLYKFRPSVFGVFVLRDAIFRTGFNGYMVANKTNHTDYRMYHKIMFAIMLGVFISQPLDFAFIRMTNDQLAKYSSVRGTLTSTMFEESALTIFLKGFPTRFFYLCLYFQSMMIFNKTGHQYLQMNSRR